MQAIKFSWGNYATVYKLATGKHVESKYNLWSHRFSINQLPIHFDMRKFSFTNRIIAPMWNSLPDSVVSANTIDAFKIRLDRFWFDQGIKYNWKADIHTGSRSQVDVILN